MIRITPRSRSGDTRSSNGYLIALPGLGLGFPLRAGWAERTPARPFLSQLQRDLAPDGTGVLVVVHVFEWRMKNGHCQVTLPV